MKQTHLRATERLHLGRLSADGAVYFVTFVTARREPWLAETRAADAVLATIRAWHAEGDGAIWAAPILPNHVHVLFELGGKLDVGRCVSRWKTVGRRAAGYAGEWQRDFWDHRIRIHESLEDYGLYVFLNPYRAGLVAFDRVWPWWWAPETRAKVWRDVAEAQPRFEFVRHLIDGAPRPEWVSWPDERFAEIRAGE